jgi:hypothetical protein
MKLIEVKPIKSVTFSIDDNIVYFYILFHPKHFLYGVEILNGEIINKDKISPNIGFEYVEGYLSFSDLISFIEVTGKYIKFNVLSSYLKTSLYNNYWVWGTVFSSNEDNNKNLIEFYTHLGKQIELKLNEIKTI